jgi:PAS domain S-box-containing protein
MAESGRTAGARAGTGGGRSGDPSAAGRQDTFPAGGQRGGWCEQSPSILITTDLAGVILAVNRFGAEYLGYPPDTLPGRLASTIVHTEDRPAFVEHIALCREAPGAVHRIEFRKIRGDGSMIWVREAARVVDGPQGDAVIVTACEDITDRVRADERMQFLVDAGRVLASSLDYDTTLRTVADLAVPRLADWCSIDLLEEGAIRRVAVAHADPARMALAEEYQRRYPPDPDAGFGVARVLRTGEPQLLREVTEDVLRAVSRDDEQYEILRSLGFCSALVVPLPVGDRIIGAITLIAAESGRRYGSDELSTAELLAQRAALSVEKARLYRASREATQARDEMLSIVSHDLRNPLNTILLSAGHLLEIGAASDEQSRDVHLQIIRRQAKQMNRLIEDLLDVARVEAGRLPLSERREDPALLVADACESLSPLASQKGVHLEGQAPDGLPQVCADRHRVLQLFGNLVGNAIRHTEPGGTVRVSAEQDGDTIRFAVTDTGSGIAAADMPHLFERFYQASTTGRGGAGLGLAIARGIVEAHGGRIAVESRLGHGSVFHFSIPTAQNRGR